MVGPSTATRALGILGILGGAWLVAWLLPFVPWGPAGINLRVMTFNVGAIAVGMGLYLQLAADRSRLASLVLVAVILANACYLAMAVVAVGRPQPPAPDPAFRLAWFWAGVAMWWADAALGGVALRVGGRARWGGVALAVGSVLAFLGMDRLELVAGAYQAIVVPLALAGITANGVGWILLGLHLLIGGTGKRRANASLTA
jgi:hypothetical protein